MLTRHVNEEVQLNVRSVTNLVQLLAVFGPDVQMFIILPVHSKTMLRSSKTRLLLVVKVFALCSTHSYVTHTQFIAECIAYELPASLTRDH